MDLLGQRLHQRYADAFSPCVLCLMSREDVKTILLSDPRIAARIAEILGQRLITAEQRLTDVTFKSLPQRVASLLLQLAQPPKARLFRPGSLHEVPYTHEALAEMTGAYRETITKILNGLRAHDVIERKRGRIVIRDLDGLRALSNSVGE
jgi:CRP-like cAMP-binding protein